MRSGSWKLLALLAVLVAALLGGGTVYLNQRAGQAVDRLARSLEPAGQLSYGSLGVSPGGSLTLTDVDWAPEEGGGEVFARRLRLNPGGPLALLELTRRLEAGRWPESLRLTAEDILLDTSGPLAERASGPWGLLPLVTPADARACGAATRADAAMLGAMGFTMLSTDLVVELRHPPASGELLLLWQAETSGLSGHRLELRLGVDPDAGPGQLADARVLELKLGYIDLGFGRARNLYCAGQLELAPEAFVERQLEAVVRSRQAPPGDGLRRAYADYLRHGGELQWHARPGDAAPTLAELAAMDADARLAVLQPAFSINGAPVTEPARAWLPRSAPAGPTAAPAAAAAPPPEPDSAGFQAVEVADLDGLEGHTLRLRTRQGARLQGRLERLGERELVLRRREAGGSAELPVQLADIEEVEVFR